LFNRPQPVIQYFADSSYWVYLTHLPIVGLIQVDLFAVPTHAELKFLIVLVGTMALTLTSYQVMVRHTFLGLWLHGRRDRARSILPSSPHRRTRLAVRSLSSRREFAAKSPEA
jgi:glucan biosynthesis protein C